VTVAPTPSQTVGPFFAFGLCAEAQAELVPAGTPGSVTIAGRVLDGAGDPVPDALVEIWQADPDGRYRDDFGWGRCGTDGAGRFAFTTVKPGRAGPQAPHLVVQVFARGLLKPVLTRIYFPDEERANAEDPVLVAIAEERERATLVARARDGELAFDVQLQGERQTVFFAV
jgi:protocatechuate 3,4-dioxygenase alpha subunit